MSDYIETLKAQLEPDRGSPDAEWQVITMLLQQHESESDNLLRWVFVDSKAYTETRARAGVVYLQDKPAEGPSILERLVASDDPNDRDTALEVLAAWGDAEWAHLAISLLADPYPYLQLDAAEFLWKRHPEQAKACLCKLTEHEASWVRKAAQELLLRIKEGAGA